MDIKKALLVKSLRELLKITAKNYSIYSDLIRSIFYTEKTLCKLLCKPKDQVATEDKNKIVYQIDCSNCEAVCFSESKMVFKNAF